MSLHTQDTELAHLLAHARTHPYFPLESAIAVLLRARMERMREATQSAKHLFGGFHHEPISVVKTFMWPSEELCVCLHKAEEETLYVFDVQSGRVQQILSQEPVLQRVHDNDRIVVLNAWTHEVIPSDVLEEILLRHKKDTDTAVREELHRQALVRTRSSHKEQPIPFAASVIQVFQHEHFLP